MKIRFIQLIIISFWIPAIGQVPLPCKVYTQENAATLNAFSGTTSIRCLDIDMPDGPGAAPYLLSDNEEREFFVTRGEIQPGFSYLPGEDSLAALRILPGSGGGEEMEGAWFAPGNYVPQLYEKIEWGVRLPTAVETAIDNWIYNDQYPDSLPLFPALNPFDPDQIDVRSMVEYTTVNGTFYNQPVFGFFMQDFERITVYNNPYGEDMQDPDDWYWNDVPSDYRFRFRWASTVEAHHSVRIIVDVPGIGHWEMEPFEFESMWHDPRESFVSVTQNGHYFKTDDGHVYFPVGLNINEGTFGCNCMEGYIDTDSTDIDPGFCEDCYEWGFDDPCCGIRRNKRKRAGIYPEYDSSGQSIGVRGYTLDPAAYVKLERILETIKEKGGNSFRTLIDPTQYDIEFEKLNNYYDRQYQAWEFDQLLKKSEELSLRIELNMMIHYALTYHPAGFDKFDWDYSQNCDGCDEETGVNGTHGYCYWNELNLTTPLDFLINSAARSNYKKKIRYMISRWGYSKNIFLLELLSEMNNIGLIEIGEEETDLNNDGNLNDLVGFPSLYNSNPWVTRPAVAAWHGEMASYIKAELQHTRHLISADYAGAAPMGTDMNGDRDNDDEELGETSNPCITEFYDQSWHDPNIDVLSFSNYSAGWNRWEKMAVQEYSNNDQSQGLLCEFPNSANNSVIDGFSNLTKPVCYAETGSVQCIANDYSGFVKDILASTFSGHSTSGMSWDESTETAYWHVMGQVNSFLENQILNSVDLGTNNWTPSHNYSEDDPLQLDPNNENGHEDERVEVVYLTNNNLDDPKFFGVIMNRTWNFYTTGIGSCVTSNWLTEVFSGPHGSLDNLVEVGWENEKIHLQGVPDRSYTIRYFDPVSGIKLNEEIVHASNSNNLNLVNYPLMYDGSNNHHPYYFFLAFEEGEEFEGFVLENEELESTQTLSQKQDEAGNTIHEQFEYRHKLIVYPNPASSSITVESYNETWIDPIFLTDISGRHIVVIQSPDKRQIVDTSTLSSGVYFLHNTQEFIPIFICHE